MKKLRILPLLLALVMLSACGSVPPTDTSSSTEGATILLSDEGITVEGAEEGAVYTAQDILSLPKNKAVIR